MKKKDFIQSLAALTEQFRRTIETQVDGFDDTPQAIIARRNQVFDPVGGFEFFVNAYFPHYVRSDSKSQLHEYLFVRLPQIIAGDTGQNDAVAAPRGEAKSTLVTKLFVLWCMAVACKKYIIIAMDTYEQAVQQLAAVKAELEFNPRLQTDFPELFGRGRVWQENAIVSVNGIRLEAVGAGQKLRGRIFGAYRPDLVVLDDLENDENVRTAAQRDKLHQWVISAVLPLGGVGQKLDVVYIGTILHYDSPLNRILHNPFWRSVKFKALVSLPERMDLWDEWEAILRNSGHAGAAMAQAFYEANQAEMERGAQTSWAARGVLALMKIRARDGHAAFDAEYQNDPVSADNAPFANAMRFWTDLPHDLVYFGALDPSLGKAGANRDPSAILVGAYQRSSGRLFVVEAQIKKRLPDLIIEDVIRLHKQYRCAVWFVETVQFQEFLKDELVKRSAQRGYPVPARAVKPNSDKILRIETLQPHMANGLILLHSSQSTLIEQLRHFPKAAHDDGADALQMLWAGAVSNAAPIEWRSTADDDFDGNEFQSKWAK